MMDFLYQVPALIMMDIRSAHIFAQLSGKYDENTNYEIQLQDVTTITI